MLTLRALSDAECPRSSSYALNGADRYCKERFCGQGVASVIEAFLASLFFIGDSHTFPIVGTEGPG